MVLAYGDKSRIVHLQRFFSQTDSRTIIKSIIYGSFLSLSLLILYLWLFSSEETISCTNHLQVEQYVDIEHTCDYLLRNPIGMSSDKNVGNIRRQTTYSDLCSPYGCSEFKLFQGYTVHSSMEEEQFPLAFSLAIHENIRQVSRLLRLIYRPQNLYCIHVDSKSPQQFYDEVTALSRCFGSNVMVIDRSESVNVQWGYYSILEVFLMCADKLMRNTKYMWKYILNVSGQELPLRTNWELVAALKAINGSNVVEGLGPRHNPSRWPQKNFSFPVVWNKGSFYMALKREFVQFYQTNSKAKEILNAMKAEEHLCKHPDELFFPTLAYNPQLGAPGACLAYPNTNNSDPRTAFVARYVTWAHRGCISKRSRRGVCIIGAANLLQIPQRMEFFANKYHEDFEPIAYDCTEYYIMSKVVREMLMKRLDPDFNVTYYSRLYCSQDHI
ncbi:unnamed protein product [Heterobilharzia americana]|nr:unnamed protein product [Heterobilharzia americana]CAH8456891.1 unnamed protein product [Heterobilharzia americana]